MLEWKDILINFIKLIIICMLLLFMEIPSNWFAFSFIFCIEYTLSSMILDIWISLLFLWLFFQATFISNSPNPSQLILFFFYQIMTLLCIFLPQDTFSNVISSSLLIVICVALVFNFVQSFSDWNCVEPFC